MGRKYGLKILGLSLLAAVGLMAMSAAAAQAGSEFQVNGVSLAGEKAIKGTAGAGDLLTAGGTELGCTGGTISGAIKNLNTTPKIGHVKMQILYTGCTILGASSVCKIYEELPKLGQDGILLSSEGELFVHTDGKHYLLLKGLGVNQLFTDFVVLDPLLLERCTIPEEHYTVTGSTVLSLPDALTLAKLHKIDTIDPSLLGTGKLFPNDQKFLGKEKAHLKGGISSSVELVSGESWRVN